MEKRTNISLLKLLQKNGYTLRDLAAFVSPDFYNGIDEMIQQGDDIDMLLCIIATNGLPVNFEMGHLEEKISNHYEMI